MLGIPRLVLHGSPSNWGIRVEQPKQVAKIIGADVLAAFYKCFVGIDRLMTLEHLVFISQIEHAAQNGGRDTPSAERDMQLLAFLLAGTLYELGEALQQLTSAKCVLLLRDREAWTPINKFRKEWHKNAYAAKIRNGYSHHLGEIDTFKSGIEESPGRGRVDCRAHNSAPWRSIHRTLGCADARRQTRQQRGGDDRVRYLR